MYPHFYLRLPQEALLQGSIVFDRKKKKEGLCTKILANGIVHLDIRAVIQLSSHNSNKKNLQA